MLIILMWWVTAKIAAAQFCKSEIQITSGIMITWPHARVNETVESSPYCLNEYKIPYKRKCLGATFDEAPSCDYFVTKLTPKCPPGYQELQVPGEDESEYICLLVTPPQAWNSTCLPSGSTESILHLPYRSQTFVTNFLKDTKKVNRFWMPARRDQEYDPVVWYLPGEKLGTLIDFDDYNIILDNVNQFHGDCLQIELVGGVNLKVKVENCNIKLPIVCIFRQNPILELACGPNQFTTRYAAYQDRCFSIEKNTQQFDGNYDSLFTPDSLDKLNIFEKISESVDDFDSDDKCLVNAPFVISNQTVKVDKSGKWIGDSTDYTCLVYDREYEAQEPAIYLKFHPRIGKLFVTIYHPEFLWREDDDHSGIQCFTNSDNELIKQVQVQSRVWSGLFQTNSMVKDSKSEVTTKKTNITKTIYEVKLYGDGPGYYFCHGLAVRSFKLIESPKIVASKKDKGAVFASLVDVKCSYQCSTCFHKKYLKDISKDLKRHLDGLVVTQNLRRYVHLITNVRVMKIDQIDVVQSQMRLLFHITMSENPDLLAKLSYTEENENTGNGKKFLATSGETIVYYKLKSILSEIMQASKNDKFHFISLNSTEFCLPNMLSAINEFNWITTRIGETSVPKELCILSNGLPLMRKCVGDFLYGGVWEAYQPNIRCLNPDVLNPLTHYLHNLGLADDSGTGNGEASATEAPTTPQIIQNISQITTNYTSLLIPADIFYLSKTLQSLSNNLIKTDNSTTTSTTPTSTSSPTVSSIEHNQNLLYEENYNLATILNNLMNVNETIIQMTQMTLNTTNILLDSFDNLINKISLYTQLTTNGKQLNQPHHQQSDGTNCVITPNIITCTLDPTVANVSGIALYRNETLGQTVFSDYSIKKLTIHQNMLELLGSDGLEIGAYVPESLLLQIQNASDATALNVTTPLRIVITIYYHDRLFQENVPIVFAKSATKIISVAIPGYGTDLPALLPIYYSIPAERRSLNDSEINKCGYWNFSPSNITSMGEWSYDGCEYIDSSPQNENLLLCGCSHLTHFAYLVLGTYMHNMASDDVIITDIHDDALDIITLLGCSLSIIGIFGIFTTALVFRTWREKPGTKILLQLSTAIALEMLLLCFVNTEYISMNLVLGEKFYNCVFIGASLHYSILVAFMWMLISAYLQFMRYVKVLGQTRPQRFVLKAALVGWGVPLLPVILTVILLPKDYIPAIDPINQGICYPKDLALYIGLLFPVCLIILANLVIFMIVIYNIIWGPDGKLRKSERELILSQLRLLIFLFFLLGLSWIFGLAAASKAGIVFSYLFCLTATLQGFVLFIYFIIMDPVIRNLWKNCFVSMRCCFCASTVDAKSKIQE